MGQSIDVYRVLPCSSSVTGGTGSEQAPVGGSKVGPGGRGSWDPGGDPGRMKRGDEEANHVEITKLGRWKVFFLRLRQRAASLVYFQMRRR